MPTDIKLKNSVTATNAPTSLQQGEVAINITDKKVWVGNAATTPVQLLGDGGSGSFTSIAFGDGTVSAPSITNIGDTNTGIYFPAADTIAFTEGGVESMRIDASGNLGIGTNSPAVRLQVIGSAAFGDGTNGQLRLTSNASINYIDSLNNAASAWQRMDSRGVAFNWFTAASGTPSTGMTLDSAGNVGIGTSSPGARLVVSNGTQGMEFGYSASLSGNYIESISRPSAAGVDMNYFIAGTAVHKFFTAATERMRIDSSGNVGIATSTVSTIRFRVASAADWIMIGRNAADSSDVFGVAASGNVQNTNNSYGAFSDIKLKENIVSVSPKLDKLMQVNIVNYNLKNNPKQKLIGVIAQQLEQVIPSLVEELADRDEEGNDLGTVTKSVKYSVFVPMLIKSIQELKAIVDAQAARIAALESK
jgi:hypothetical protein